MATQVEAKPISDSMIVKTIREHGVEESTAIALRDSFQPIWDILAEPLEQANSINVTNITQVEQMKAAGELRKALKAARLACEKTRKELKEDSLKRGQTIDAIAKKIRSLIDPAEERMEQMEKFAEVQEAKMKAERAEARKNQLLPYIPDLSFYDLVNMTEPMYERLLTDAKLAHEAKAAAAKKAEEDRLAVEAARLAEEKRIREENDRLRAEAAKAEAERKQAEETARKEREAIQAKAEAERKEAAAKAQAEHDRLQAIAAEERARAAKLEAEAKAKEDAERQRIEAEAAAPDKAKVLRIAELLNAIEMPECTTPKAKELVRKIGIEIINLAARVTKAGESM